MQRPVPLRPDRLRTLERPFGWIPLRLLRSGWLQTLDSPQQLLYFFLCLVADRNGLSFYGDPRLEALLGLPDSLLYAARRRLCELDLLAYDGRLYQLLSLPPPPSRQLPRLQPAPPLRSRSRQGPQPIGRILAPLLGDPSDAGR